MKSVQIYIHIPFCKSKCAYCDFASWAGQEGRMAPYVQALLREMGLRAAQYGPLCASSVYIGGGTPSLLPCGLMRQVLQGLHAHFPLQEGAEVTCEANPGTLTEEFLHTLRAGGVNRLSLGAQASQTALLRALGRIHTWEQACEAAEMARSAGFDNLNLDLMFGLPGQGREDFQATLRGALALSPEHISCYGLILEEGTPFFDGASKGKLVLPKEEEERAMYEDALDLLQKAGLAAYEISNFARPGRECRHNLGYWQGAPYLGLGVAAHSRMACGPQKGAYARFGNTASLDAYLQGMGKGVIPVEEYREIPPREAEFETLMLGLRVVRGVGEADFLGRHGRTLHEAFGGRIAPLVREGFLSQEGGFLRLTRQGMDVQNAVLVELMD